MNRHDAEAAVTAYLKPVYGFALRHCRTREDAEDVAQETVLRAFRALLMRGDIDEIDDAEKFIWTVAHNTLVNYYRGRAKYAMGMADVGIDEIADFVADPDAECAFDIFDDAAGNVKRLQSEIAYLSSVQRRVVIACYFENKKQSDIARELGIPVGTVKWHLFEAKKELKRGMEKMRNYGELKFNPVKMSRISNNGTIGKRNLNDDLGTSLRQNICYTIKDGYKTAAEIADELGVSPVYIEDELRFLEGNLYVHKRGERYISGIIIDEVTSELVAMQNDMYCRAAKIFAPELCRELEESGLLECDDITVASDADRNFVMWSLIPFIAARSGEGQFKEKIRFDEVATLRPDGGHNILTAGVDNNNIAYPDDYVVMRNWCGPMWCSMEGMMMWHISSEWSEHGEDYNWKYLENAKRALSLYMREKQSQTPLSDSEIAWLAENGFVKTNGGSGGTAYEWQVVILGSKEVREKMTAIGDRVKLRHGDELEKLKAPYVKKLLEMTPEHMRRAKEYETQFIFSSDGWFILHCIVTLLKCGMLTEPKDEQKRALTTVIAPD